MRDGFEVLGITAGPELTSTLLDMINLQPGRQGSMHVFICDPMDTNITPTLDTNHAAMSDTDDTITLRRRRALPDEAIPDPDTPCCDALPKSHEAFGGAGLAGTGANVLA